jgi:hypothetical protein
MASDFDAEFAEFASPDLFDTFGEAVVYLGLGRPEQSITAIVDRLGANLETRQSHLLEVPKVRVQFRVSDFGDSVPGLTRGAAVNVEGVVFSFEAAESMSGGIQSAMFSRPIIKETTAPADI